MSLITEALRKVESGTPTIQPKDRRPGSIWLYRFLLLGSIGGVVFSSGLLIRQLKQRSSIPTQRTLFPAKRPLILTGVMRSTDGERLAIINRQVLGEGETVQGMRLVRIHEDSVDLDQQGEISVLRLKD